MVLHGIYSESELFTGDTSKDNHTPGPVVRGVRTLALIREVNLVTDSTAHSEAEIRDSVREFQSLIVWGKKLDLYISVPAIGIWNARE